jgi:hypothetical protein
LLAILSRPEHYLRFFILFLFFLVPANNRYLLYQSASWIFWLISVQRILKLLVFKFVWYLVNKVLLQDDCCSSLWLMVTSTFCMSRVNHNPDVPFVAFLVFKFITCFNFSQKHSGGMLIYKFVPWNWQLMAQPIMQLLCNRFQWIRRWGPMHLQLTVL